MSTSPLPPEVSDRSPASSCRPRLFVHYLPEAYRDPSDRIGRGVSAVLRGHLPDSFPAGVALYDSQQYALGDLFYERSLGYRCRTHDPANADLFFIPAFRAKSQFCVSCNVKSAEAAAGQSWDASNNRSGTRAASSRDAMYDRLRSVHAAGTRQSVLTARGGVDHIVINARIGAVFEVRPFHELSFRDDWLGSATRFAMEEWGSTWAQLPWPGYHAEADIYHSIPFPSVVHLSSTARGLPWAHQPLRDRRRPLVAATFSLNFKDPAVTALRKRLQRSCVRSSACQFMFPEETGASIG